MKNDFSILIVDDTPEMIDTLGEILNKYEIRVAVNGDRALKIAGGSNPPDLILLDIIMPGMSGYEVLKKLKADQKTRDIPVIFVSSLSEESDEARGLGLGAMDYITKPFKPNLVKARVRNHLELKFHKDKLEELVKERTREIVMRLVLAAKSRDTDTGMHIMRIRECTALLARKSGLSLDEAELIGLASTMHDIGKIGIPDQILLKPGKLDENEWKIMKTHCEIGERNLHGSSSKLLETGRVIALTHHERWDGKGYPAGLRDRDIPLEGRITCLADVFDALRSKRPYKEAIPLEKSTEIIQEGRGSQFDPELTDIFLDCLPEITDIRKQYPEEDDEISPFEI